MQIIFGAVQHSTVNRFLSPNQSTPTLTHIFFLTLQELAFEKGDVLTIVSELTEVSMVCVHTSFVEGKKKLCRG